LPNFLIHEENYTIWPPLFFLMKLLISKCWSNNEMVFEAVNEIINMHANYQFATRTSEQAKKYIEKNLN